MDRMLFRNNIFRALLLSLLMIAGPTIVTAQSSSPETNDENSAIAVPILKKSSPIRVAELDKWMSARILWMTFLSGVAGFLISMFYLTKVPYGPSMNAEPRARTIFVVLLTFIVPPLAVLFLFADMYVFWFPGKGLFSVLSGLFGLQVLLMLVASVSSFTVVSGLVARIKPYSHCPYLTWPKNLTRS
ncbi:MAG TPA: hypothetical protein VFI24_26060 [Pyrinomonadaceae bacterium]|nr:hypothetical protein [Pyrinomonadaceae bacterium]